MIKFVKYIGLFSLIMLLNFNIAKADTKKNLISNVNKYAWMASLQTISFMPLQMSDPASGVIITDWYQIDPNSRYKVDIYVLNGILNSQSVDVKVFKQIKIKSEWQYTAVSSEVSSKLEDIILNKARELNYQQN